MSSIRKKGRVLDTHPAGLSGSRGSMVQRQLLGPEAETASLPGPDRGVVLEAAAGK